MNINILKIKFYWKNNINVSFTKLNNGFNWFCTCLQNYTPKGIVLTMKFITNEYKCLVKKLYYTMCGPKEVIKKTLENQLCTKSKNQPTLVFTNVGWVCTSAYTMVCDVLTNRQHWKKRNKPN